MMQIYVLLNECCLHAQLLTCTCRLVRRYMYPQIQILDETICTCTMIDCRYQVRNPQGFYVHGYQHENPIASNQRIYKL